jgi:hypothetical protein
MIDLVACGLQVDRNFSESCFWFWIEFIFMSFLSTFLYFYDCVCGFVFAAVFISFVI